MSTSEYEGISLTTREALAHAAPIVAYDMPWLTLMQDGKFKSQDAYGQKGELNRKLQTVYEQKNELNRKLQVTYGEKFERGVEIKHLKQRISAIENSTTFKVGKIIMFLPKKVKNLIKRILR